MKITYINKPDKNSSANINKPNSIPSTNPNHNPQIKINGKEISNIQYDDYIKSKLIEDS